MDWREEYQSKLCSLEEAVEIVHDGDIVFIGAASSVACALSEALYNRKQELNDVTICSGQNPWILPFYKDDQDSPFSVLTFFTGPAERESLKHNNCTYTSMYLSKFPDFANSFLKGSVGFFEVSPPDEHGFMAYGALGVALLDAVKDVADHIVVQVNKNAPYVYGIKNMIHVSEIDRITEADRPIIEVPDEAFDEETKSIASIIVDQIPDGATIQTGLGGLSAAIGHGLRNKCDLGIHSEMFSNAMKELMEAGVINNKKKTFLPGRSVAAFALGTRDIYDFVNRNPAMFFAPFSFVNNPRIIAQNDNLISVNTAMSIDLYGQVVADNLGGRQQSAVGGQVDFVRGAQMSKGGKSFIALPSTLTKQGKTESRIVAALPRGTAVTTSRQDVQYVVTERGCVNLKNYDQEGRANALISIADPAFRDELTEQAKELGILR